MANRAFVRYKKCADIVPGSLIITNGTYPEPLAGWLEVPMKLDCSYIRLTQTATAGNPDEICFTGFAIMYGQYGFISSTWYGSTTTVSELINGLNTVYGFLGKWSAQGLEITLDMKPEIANAYLAKNNVPAGEVFNLNFYCGG